ncbi:kinase-like protein [Lophium mytilinum]|uniref:Kinase-like protein n=1 Tax=Lophium mytilinum TaxID=390894 RepID=A0A6A6R2W9_9PEZI|nr:kinase-like protein [Lophium mytilinum]
MELALSGLLHRNEPGMRKRPRPYSEEEIKTISVVLATDGHYEWSRNPRVYIALYTINEEDEMDEFVKRGVNDMCLPYDSKSFPGAFKTEILKTRFLYAQKHVLSTQNDLSSGKHLNVQSYSDLKIRIGDRLGRGAQSAEVRKISQNSQCYAMKLTHRAAIFDTDLETLRKFEVELQSAKKVQHHHVVRVTASFTDTDYFGIVMGTVGECNLADYLVSPSRDSKVLRSLFVCLTSGLKAIHGASLRHKDIKPENIVLRGHIPYYTDFGLAFDFEGSGSTTTGEARGFTRHYAAPEVRDSSPRNTSSDLWSLGVVFLEIATVLAQQSVARLRSYLKNNGTTNSQYPLNLEGLTKWVNIIREESPDDADGWFTIPPPGNSDDAPFRWIESLIQEQPRLRPSATKLFKTVAKDMKADYTEKCLCNHCVQEIETTLPIVPFIPRPGTTPSVALTTPSVARTTPSVARNTPSMARPSSVPPIGAPPFQRATDDVTLLYNVDSNTVADRQTHGFGGGGKENPWVWSAEHQDHYRVTYEQCSTTLAPEKRYAFTDIIIDPEYHWSKSQRSLP